MVPIGDLCNGLHDFSRAHKDIIRSPYCSWTHLYVFMIQEKYNGDENKSLKSVFRLIRDFLIPKKQDILIFDH